LKHYIDQVFASTGAVLPGAVVTVRVANASPGTGALANIYAVDSTATPISGSQVTADSTGTFDFYAPDGRYDLTVSVGGATKIVADTEISDITEANNGDSTHTVTTLSTTTVNTSTLAATGNITTRAALLLAKGDGTLPGTIANDTAGGINVTTNGGKIWEFANAGALSSPAGSGVQFNGGSSGAVSIVAPAAAGANVLTLPAATDIIVGKATTDVLTNKTLTAPVINGTPTGTGIPTVTLKKGSGGGNYTTSSATYVQVDSTNLLYTVTIPTGWKLIATAGADITSNTAAVLVLIAIADGGSVIVESGVTPSAATVVSRINCSTIITGDGASHTIDLRFRTSNVADAAVLTNITSTLLPTMTFLLTPSN